MRAFILNIISIASLTCLVAPSVNAQSIFGFGTNNNETTAPKTMASPPNQAMTPDQFQNRVNTMQSPPTPAQNQINQILNAKQPGPPAPEKAGESTTVTQTGQSVANPPVGTGSPTSPIAQPNIAPAPTSAPAQNGGTTLPAPQTSVTTPSQPQPQPYTGFGVPANNNGGTNNNTKQSGGWNIKY